jgi:hypothetical protein
LAKYHAIAANALIKNRHQNPRPGGEPMETTEIDQVILEAKEQIGHDKMPILIDSLTPRNNSEIEASMSGKKY